MPTIPPLTAVQRAGTIDGRGFARRARHAAHRVLTAVAAGAGAAVRLLTSAARGDAPSSLRADLRFLVPALVPARVPAEVRTAPPTVVRLHTARRQARLAGHPAGWCREW